MELADTSAWAVRRRDPDVSTAFARAVSRGSIATCDMVKLELLREARSTDEIAAQREELDALRNAPIGGRVWQRALDVLEQLAARGPLHHGQVPLPDLLIAAAAERLEVPVLHYDHHFDVIASITGQPVRALAPLGSL